MNDGAAPRGEAVTCELRELQQRLKALSAERDALQQTNAKLTRSLTWMSAQLDDSGGGIARITAELAAAEQAQARAAAAERTARRLSVERETLFDMCCALRAAAASRASCVPPSDEHVDWLSPCSPRWGDAQLASRCARGHVTVTLVRATPAQAPAGGGPPPLPSRPTARPAPQEPTDLAAPAPLVSGGCALKLIPAEQRPARAVPAGGVASARETASQAAAAAALSSAATQRAARLESGKPRAVDWAAARRTAELAARLLQQKHERPRPLQESEGLRGNLDV